MSHGKWEVSHRAAVERMVRAGHGISAADVARAFGVSVARAYDDLRRLAGQKRIAKHGGRGGVLWTAPGVVLGKVPPATPSTNKRRPEPTAAQRKGQKLTLDKERCGAGPRTGGDVVVPANVKRTYIPAPLGRFEVPADHRGPFSLAGVGRDVTTGRGWA